MASAPSIYGSRNRRFGAGTAGRLPSSVRRGSAASWNKEATTTMRKDMLHIVRNYERLIATLKNMTPNALHDALMPVLRQSLIYVPKKTGDLAETAEVTVGTDESGRPMATITYGSPSVKYAAIVHEFTHLNHEPPTRAKYLQSALEEQYDAVLTSLLVDYAAVLK